MLSLKGFASFFMTLGEKTLYIIRSDVLFEPFLRYSQNTARNACVTLNLALNFVKKWDTERLVEYDLEKYKIVTQGVLSTGRLHGYQNRAAVVQAYTICTRNT